MLLLAGLKAIDKELYEAAEVDGANAVHRFLHITLPGLRYVITVTVLLSTISTFNTFGLVYLMTGGGPGGATRLYSILAYERAIVGLRFGPGAAVALSMAPFLAIFILLLARFMRQDLGGNASDTAADRALSWVGKGLMFAIDLVLWPFAWLANRLGRGLAAAKASLTSGRAAARGQTPRIHPRRAQALGFAPADATDLAPSRICAFPILLDRHHCLQNRPPDPTAYRHILAYPVDAGPIPHAPGEDAVLDLVRQHRHCGGHQHDSGSCVLSLAGYALARLKFLGANTLTTALLITYLLPGALLFIPLYSILTTLGIINSYAALIATYPTFLMPFATWVMLGYYRSIPEDLEEAGMIDGANRLGAFLKITLPLAAPGLLAVTLFSFTNAWNEFLFAFVFITSENLKTLPVGLQLLVFGDIYPWGQLMGASLLMAIPVVILYTYAQKYMVEGLTAGSMKG